MPVQQETPRSINSDLGKHVVNFVVILRITYLNSGITQK